LDRLNGKPKQQFPSLSW